MISRKPWTEEEDGALRQLHEARQITKWAEISRLMLQEFHISGRSGKQCRQRYNNHLDQSIKHQKWSCQEENMLIDLHNQAGNRWAEIARSMSGRSENCVKNQLYSILRRGLRHINTVIRTKLKRYKQLQISVIYQIIEACQSNFKRKTWTKQIHEYMDLKKQIFYYATHTDNSNDEEELKKIKQLTERIKVFLKNSRQNFEENQIDLEKQSEAIESEEYRDNFPIVVQTKQVEKQRKDSFLTFRLQNVDEGREEKFEQKTAKQTAFKSRKESFQSNHSFSMNSPHLFELMSPNSTLKSHEEQEYYQYISPKPLISLQTPFYDHLRGNFNSWFHFIPK